MSCQMTAFGAVVDLEGVKKCLYLEGLTSGSLTQSSSSTQSKSEPTSQDVWGWSVEETEKPVSHPSWLEECKLSMSPSGELLALTHRQNLIILTSKWDSNEESTSKTKYHMVWNGDPCQEHNEVITSLCVLPIAPPQAQRSSHSAPDWTCIALGFSSGALRFYTENGDLLLSEVLEEEPVLTIKCQTATPPRYSGQSELTDELHVSYRNVVCSIYGFVLCNTLRACRNQLARVQAGVSDAIVAPPLSLHKWSLPDQDNISDREVGLPQCPPAFQHLHIASVCGGFSTWYRPSPPQSGLVVAAGVKPFVGFHYIIEGSNAPVLTDVVKAVGTKVKSAISQAVPSWLLGGRKSNSTPEKEKVVIEPAEPMSCRFGLCDLWRQGSSVVMSPQRNLCVVADTLGRITLVDNCSGLALRMWKGYRDAQCGWVMAEEEQGKGRKRVALFLVIYAPKKGMVEVWAMQQGPRVATFTTSKHGRLFYINYGLLGTSNLTNKNLNRSTTPCVFVDELGTLTDITVPFHCALSDKNSKRARDMHLVRKLRQLLKDSEAEESAAAVTALCRELQTDAIRGQALDVLASSRQVLANTLLEVVEAFLLTFETQGEQAVDAGRKNLSTRCVKLQKLLIFFMFCSSLQQKPPAYDTVLAGESNNDVESLSEFLRMTNEDTLRILRLPGNKHEKLRVKFQEGPEGLPGFLGGFQIDSSPSEMIRLLDPATNQNIGHISEVVCTGAEGNIPSWSNAAGESGIDPADLLRFALVAWLNRCTPPNIMDTHNFGQLVTTICYIAGDKVQEPLWWEDVRTILKESTQPSLAVIAAAISKAVAIACEEMAVMTASANTDDSEVKSSDWEKVTQESCSWSLLISQLEDVALINSVLRHKPESSSTPTLHCLSYDPPQLSLQSVCSKGKGCVTELVARWVGSAGLDPSLLLENKVSRPSSLSPAKEGVSLGVAEGQIVSVDTGEEAKPVSEADARILAQLATLRRQFPYSLCDSVLVANLAWEYVLHWSRQVDELSCLQAAVTCLKVIPSPLLTHGVCRLLWEMHLESKYEPTTLLINKIGKVPKERLCRQDIGLSELQISDFFNICADFFEVFMESRALIEEGDSEQFRHEGLWESSPVPPLHELALGRHHYCLANYDVLLLLSQASRAFHLLVVFSLRTHRPLTAFFDSIGQNALFADISGHVQLPSHVVDSALTQSRTAFLLRAVTAATATITRHEGEYNITSGVEWMKQCLLLASDWSISPDPLRRQQCRELYARGFDRLAEEVIPQVSDTSALGSQLLTVAGLRLRLSMAESKSQLREQMTHMSPALSTWISALSEEDVESVPLADTLELVVMVLSLLEEESDLKRIGTLMLDSLGPIVSRESQINR